MTFGISFPGPGSVSPADRRLQRTRCEVPILSETATEPIVIKVHEQAARKCYLVAVGLHVRPKLHRHPVAVDERASHSHPNIALRARRRFPITLDAGPALVDVL